jgi:hypothetical protein
VRWQWSAITFCCSSTCLWNVSVSWSSICSRLWDLEGNRRISDHVLRYSSNSNALLVQWDLFDSVFFFQLVLRIQIRLFSSPDPGSESFPTCPCRFPDLGVKKRHRIRIRNTIWSIIIFPLGSINYGVQTYNLWLLHEWYAALSTLIKSWCSVDRKKFQKPVLRIRNKSFSSDFGSGSGLKLVLFSDPDSKS